MFDLIVPVKRTGSCVTTPMDLLKSTKLTFFRSVLEMDISPETQGDKLTSYLLVADLKTDRGKLSTGKIKIIN